MDFGIGWLFGTAELWALTKNTFAMIAHYVYGQSMAAIAVIVLSVMHLFQLSDTGESR